MFTVISSVCLVQSQMNTYTVMFWVTPYFNSPLINGYTHYSVVISQQLELALQLDILYYYCMVIHFINVILTFDILGKNAHLQESV